MRHSSRKGAVDVQAACVATEDRACFCNGVKCLSTVVKSLRPCGIGTGVVFGESRVIEHLWSNAKTISASVQLLFAVYVLRVPTERVRKAGSILRMNCGCDTRPLPSFSCAAKTTFAPGPKALCVWRLGFRAVLATL
ncbi:hypothetical protein SKAU_G00303570 [Synaphobranchus kaupii]|uniref:Uncharacterized protein n=1 Tax=Synaphobranchus kaupii TaxID=118154 RepID=A0A9Q1EW45_SYNKA|nr:hypothetical protein SKAU_G00303570 [Synaphobranchus kaupii]